MEKQLKWEQIRDILFHICDTVYYDPPTSIQMQYPCFRFTMNNTDSKYADNIHYINTKRWALTYITRDVEEIDMVIKKVLDAFKYCTHETTFKSDNLNNVVFNLYF